MTRYGIGFHKDTAIDYNEAYNWYEEQQVGLGEKFLAAVNNKIQQILSNPKYYSIKFKTGYHETSVQGFPYSIVYRIYEKQKMVVIISIHHQKKNPRKKYRK